MRTRTFLILVVTMALVAVGAWVVLADGGDTITDWIASVHGRPGGGH
jgi:hypothetical protein